MRTVVLISSFMIAKAIGGPALYFSWMQSLIIGIVLLFAIVLDVAYLVEVDSKTKDGD